MRIHLSPGVERNNQEEINPIDDRESEESEVPSASTVESRYGAPVRCTGLLTN